MLGSIFNIVNFSLIFTICNPIWILWLPNYPITSNYTCFKQNWKHLINSKWRIQMAVGFRSKETQPPG